MDCRTVLELLELPAPPDPADEADPRRAEALSHVSECPTCAATRGLRERFDRRIARSMRDVTLPTGLRDGILAALAADRSDAPQSEPYAFSIETGPTPAVVSAPALVPIPANAPDATRPAPAVVDPSGRRRLLKRLAVVATVIEAVAFLGAIGWWRLREPADPPVDLAAVRQDLAERFDELPQAVTATADAAVPLPPYDWPARAVAFDPTARTWTASDGRASGTAYRFEIREPGRAPVSAVVLALPAARVRPLPDARHLAATGTEYVSAGSVRFATAVWTEGDVVYVCLVRSGGDTLDRLRHALESVPT